MPDPRVTRLAEVICRYSLELRQGDVFLIRAPLVAEELMYAVYREALRCGAFPVVQPELPELEGIFLREASEAQLGHVSPLRRHAMETVDATLGVIAETNTKALTSVDPQRQSVVRSAQGEITKLFLERAARGELRWCLTAFPAQGNAQDAEMSLEEYADFVYTAARLNEPDPVAAWKAVAERQERITKLLQSHHRIRVVGSGTDLVMSTSGRTWLNDRGTHNLPGGEVFTGPVEDSLEGEISFHFPALVDGKELDGVRLEFEKGRVVRGSASKGDALLQALLATDEGARRAGEFAFGLNEQIQRGTKELLFDEKIGGTCHLALGASYPESGGLNESALHQDMVCDLRQGGEVYLDGEQVYADGAFFEKALAG